MVVPSSQYVSHMSVVSTWSIVKTVEGKAENT